MIPILKTRKLIYVIGVLSPCLRSSLITIQGLNDDALSPFNACWASHPMNSISVLQGCSAEGFVGTFTFTS